MDGKRHAEAWKAWLASAEGKSCADANTLVSFGQRANSFYLENRLFRAFAAGVKAAEEAAEAERAGDAAIE